ncbi:MAG: flagellar hook-associated protein FlgK [Sulfurimicrobium sp.]|nr:flagellar hook-associated protein FlgK [Sulfurimicrobium sp.]MDP1704886.1 flagellar hook-associated protein FlgK [Sulfurimicrobium sp.]MDP2199167.1 flagellar hook-associated protein FlgK [Sulfurimicrobium sp.]
MSGALDVGISGLRAAQIGLTTTGHNITNAATPGYHRQEIVQSASTPVNTGAGFLGTGVSVNAVKRVYSDFLELQVQTAQTQSSYLEIYSAQISQFNNMVADPSAGLSPALQQFFQGVHDVAANPASVPSRQSMISSADALVTRFQTLNQRFDEIREGINSQVTASVSMINSYARQIAELNSRVVIAQASSNGQPNDLLDLRDNLIAELNKEINVSVVKQSDGAYNVSIGRGQALVVGKQAYTLTAQPALDDPSRIDVAYQTGGNEALFLQRDSLNSGNLGGLLAFRAESLDASQNALGRVAIGLAQTMNDQHRLGQDLNGALGGALFNVMGPNGTTGAFSVPSAKVVANLNNSDLNPAGSPTVALSDVSKVTTSDYTLAYSAAGYTLTKLSDNSVLFANVALPQTTADGLTIAAPTTAPVNGDSWLIQPTRYGARDISVAIHDTAKIAAAAPIIAEADFVNNTGTGKISAGVVNVPVPPPTDPNLQKPVTITFTSATTFDVSSPSSVPPIALTGVPYIEGADISYNGWTVKITGAPEANDTFTVGPNSNGVSDNRNALLLVGLQTQNTLAGSTASYQSAYSQIVSSIGIKTRDINVTAQAQASLVKQSQQAQQSLSGVNLDEEAANLLRYQQAYQAAGKMMQIASTMFDTLLGLGR